jgi:hypothetical protein
VCVRGLSVRVGERRCQIVCGVCARVRTHGNEMKCVCTAAAHLVSDEISCELDCNRGGGEWEVVNGRWRGREQAEKVA